MSSGQDLWGKARKIIPGGGMLLSKRAEMFAPGLWPAYFSRAKGCHVWDLDGQEYLDMALMGVGTNTLGYGDERVDSAVMQAVQAGNMSSLNAPEEVALAERLIGINGFADMVRLCRTGGEANAVAIRIARAASGKEIVAFCGYHGWHDWYLAANLGAKDGLDGHLLPGLNPGGVPKSLTGTVKPFHYNRLDQLEAIIAEGDVGVIKMEVSRNDGPAPGFLEGVRKLASDNGIVLIFDECTSGFRETFGGLYQQFGVEPDIAIYSKALGNGYAISAVVGSHAVMDTAQSTFISSTFWTERIGPVAALATLDAMEQDRSWDKISKTGDTIRAGWQALARHHGLDIAYWGLRPLGGFTIKSEKALAYKTLITQELLKAGILATNSVHASTAHDDAAVSRYLDALDPVFGLIADCENGRDVADLLDGEICHGGFKRLN